MPIIKSAKKRVKVAEKAAIRNSKVKRELKTAVKELQEALTGKNSSKINEAYKKAQSAIDTAVKKNLMHKNKAARQKANLSQKMKDAGVKLAAKAPAKKPAATKTKSAAKKPATTKAKNPVKKAPAKKPAAKK